MTDMGKIRLLLSILSCVYVLAVVTGTINPRREPLPVKRYKNGKSYRAISLFRLGYDLLITEVKTVFCLLSFLLNTKKPKDHVELKIPIQINKTENVQ